MIGSNELIVDLFAGGGGASLGIFMATGRHPDVAVNHDPQAVGLHMLNHPDSLHLCNDVRKVSPAEVLRRGAEHRGLDPRRTRIGLLHASPDCKHFSKAKGGQPRDKKIRDLAWVVTRYAQLPRGQRPRIITLENVEEFRDWGPLVPGPNGGLVPCPARKGLTFRRFMRVFRDLGYASWDDEMVAFEYGAPTIRKRLFILLRDDGVPIAAPIKTHARPDSDSRVPTGMKPWRTAAEIIDWTLPCPSIFLSKEEGRKLGCKRPLVPASERRIARGTKRFVLDNPRPFIVPVTHSGDNRVHSIDEPLRTITGAHRGEFAYVEPFVTGVGGRMAQTAPRPSSAPFQTVTAKADGVLVVPHVTKFRANSIGHAADEPLHTITSNGFTETGRPGGCAPIGVVAAFLAQHNTGMTGHAAGKPVSTIVGTGSTQAVVAATFMSHAYSSNTVGGQGDVHQPVKTVTAGGQHHAVVAAFLAKYNGTAVGQRVDDPLHVAPANDRFAIVTVTIQGTVYALSDIGMRMFIPRELYRAQGFPESYIIDRLPDGTRLPKDAQVRMVGNSVSPQPYAALLRANLTPAMREAAE
jgi:DNA (cytosine-5)-methyltransferase 1